MNRLPLAFRLAIAALVVALAGCASDPVNLQPGMARTDVLQRVGAPTATYPLAGGGERLQYSRAPMGFEVTNVDLDASGRVSSVVQEMDERYFSQIQVDQWRVEDVLRTYGRPYEISQVSSFNGNVWSWRYLQVNNPRFLYIYVDPQGVVRRYHVGDDLRYDERRFRW
ncbi:hypothetical protein [Variovorax sp. OV329]|uniref:hypothetical protein n=1 Tax=Variovorax sp. OV329 TaxID=1882825 RepID=UPI0008E56C1B|nr:hypothetical protein [Variovorax sp. OV329]SFM33097.1 hypothetical protein SAMN05444747_104339 [Variovorax sp. OV329]